jgi:hypothetical protein
VLAVLAIEQLGSGGSTAALGMAQADQSWIAPPPKCTDLE